MSQTPYGDTPNEWRNDMSEKEHPEQRDDEVFLGNCTEDGFNTIGWKTKRLGETAYDVDGNKISSVTWLRPAFRKRDEKPPFREVSRST